MKFIEKKILSADEKVVLKIKRTVAPLVFKVIVFVLLAVLFFCASQIKLSINLGKISNVNMIVEIAGCVLGVVFLLVAVF